MMPTTEIPRYRTLHDNVIVNCVSYFRGHEFEFSGWPGATPRGLNLIVAPSNCRPPYIEAVNDAAKRVICWHAAYVRDHGAPDSPIDSATGEWFLPAMCGGWTGRRLPPTIADDAALPGMPRYKSTITGRLEPLERLEHRDKDGVMFANRLVEPGTVVVFLGWPEPGMQPVNESAKRVAAYWAENRSHPALRPSPWNAFSDSLFLPALAAMTPFQQRAAARMAG